MAERKAAATRKAPAGLSAEEKAAIKEHVQELKTARRGSAKADGEGEVLAKIAAMTASDRAIAERIHAIVKANAPQLVSRTWYGMPAYAKDGKVICYFRDAAKFKERYATFGFNEQARLDQGELWPTAFAIKELTPAGEAKIGALVKRAVR